MAEQQQVGQQQQAEQDPLQGQLRAAQDCK